MKKIITKAACTTNNISKYQLEDIIIVENIEWLTSECAIITNRSLQLDFTEQNEIIQTQVLLIVEDGDIMTRVIHCFNGMEQTTLILLMEK